MSEVLTVLKKARAFLAEPGRWSQGAYCRNHEGARGWVDEGYTSLSAVAAIRHVHIGKGSDGRPITAADGTANRAIDLVAAQVPHATLTAFNHDPATTHADVLAAFDRAIAAAESQAERAAA